MIRKSVAFLVLSITVLFGARPVYAVSESPLPEQFLMKKLQDIVEAQKLRQTPASREAQKRNFEQKLNDHTHHAAKALGCLITLIFVLKTTQQPQNWLDFLWHAFLLPLETMLGGYLIGSAIEPILKFIINICMSIDQEQKPIDFYHDALTEFVRHWHEFRQYSPPSLHQQIDALYIQYIKNGACIELNEDESKKIIDSVLTQSLEEHAKKLGDLRV